MRDHADDRGGYRRHGEPGSHHHGGRGGHAGQWERRGGRGHDRMERGALRLVLLDALSRGPQHGYEMIKGLEERTRGQYAPSPGALYPTLQYLADLGSVRATQEEDRRVYELTEAGRAELDAHRDRVDAFWARFTSDAPSVASRHEVGFLQDELDDLSRTIWNGLHEAIASGDRELVRRVRRAVEQCQEEVRSLIASGPIVTEPPDPAV
jgi:DNA-binding PadR family transcriptional regulator